MIFNLHPELRSLTAGSFSFESTPATVTVAASYAKNRELAILPLRANMSAAIQAHLASKMPTAPAFKMPSLSNIAWMRKKYLEAAGIAYRDSSGRYADFHALRHTFITNLARSGVHPKTAQTLARHSDINLTLSRYTHADLPRMTDAVQQLPDLAEYSQEKAEEGTG